MRPEGMTEGHEPIFYINGVEPHAHTHLLMVPWMMDPSWAILAARGRPARMFSAERSALLLLLPHLRTTRRHQTSSNVPHIIRLSNSVGALAASVRRPKDYYGVVRLTS